MNSSKQKIICVDLDGTLVKTDTLHEQIAKLVKTKLLIIFALFFYLLKGKKAFKHHLAMNVKLNPKLLPYNQTVISYLKEQHKAGAEIYLTTASHITTAKAIAEYFDFFSGYYGSDLEHNYKGRAKARLLNDEFGEKQYEYIGDSQADLAVWAHAKQAVVVTSHQRFAEKVKNICDNVTLLSSEKNIGLRRLLQGIRAYQWVKNILVFVPLLLSHSFLDDDKLSLAFAGFFLFSLLASAIYVLNDLMDLESDRAHRTKSKRLFASGDMSFPAGLILGLFLLCAPLIVSFVYFEQLFYVLLLYVVLNAFYTKFFKEVVILDVVILATFYILRLIAGAVITDAVLSFWLLTFSLFVFFSLALVKRYTELARMDSSKSTKLRGRGYRSEDAIISGILGVTSGVLSVLVIALYIHEQETQLLYSDPNWLWLTIPALLYWISRLWLLAHRNVMTDDPILFAIKDVESYIVAAMILLSMWLAV